MQSALGLTHVLKNRQSANEIQLRPEREGMVGSEDQIRVSVVVQGGGSFATMAGLQQTSSQRNASSQMWPSQVSYRETDLRCLADFWAVAG